jgi:hypothetical protein
VRSVATALCWIIATIALAAAVPACWAQRNLIDADGYAALASSAARNRTLQTAMAAELTTQVVAIARKSGYTLSAGVARGVATAYTAGPSFPDQFVDVNRVAHQWLFTDAARQNDGQWEIDLGPMLANTSLRQTLSNIGVAVPSSVTVPVTETTTTVPPGRLRPLATWGPWVSLGAAALAGVAALLTLAISRRRGRALAALGVSALLVGGGGWAAVEIGRRYIDNALNQTAGNVHTIAGVMVTNAEDSLHQWLNVTLAAGGALAVLGVIVAMLGGLLGKQPRLSATGTRTSMRP